jgi:hypothetical protein
MCAGTHVIFRWAGTPMFLVIIILICLAEVIFGSRALARNLREMKARADRKFSQVIKIMFAIGIVLAIGAFFIAYPYGQNLRIIGFPIPAAAFENRNGHWIAFDGPTTSLSMCVNAMFGFVLPHLTFRAIRQRKTR